MMESEAVTKGDCLVILKLKSVNIETVNKTATCLCNSGVAIVLRFGGC